MSGASRVEEGVSFLFVPGDRPERFGKAAAAGADVVIIDLEDAVAPGQHEVALTHAIAALHDGGMEALVRVHATDDPRHATEVETLAGLAAGSGSGLLGLIIAKADDAEAIAEVRSRFPASLAIIPLIESAVGMLDARSIAAVDGVTRLSFGAVDFSLDVTAEPAPEYLSHVRSQLVLVSRAARIAAPLDSPPVQIVDLDAVEVGARLARGFGFGGSLAIHPAQLPAIRRGFAPTEAQVAWAHAVLAAEGGAAQVDGQLVDRPVTERAHGILARAGVAR